MNLVVGATGLVGSEICLRLAESGKPVRALVRAGSDQAKKAALQKAGVGLVEGDLKDAASLRRACRGATGVISTASSTLSRREGDTIESVDRKGQCNLVDAAKAEGVGHFVFVSFRDEPGLQYPLTRAKRDVEQRLRESGMGHTILQASFFLEVWLSPALGFDPKAGRARIYGSGESKISWISFHDVVKFAVACLDNPRARNRRLEIGGPEALSPLEVVAIFEKASGRKFTVEKVPEPELRKQMAQAPDPLQESFAGLMIKYALGDAIDMRETLREFPIAMTSVADYARQVAGAS